MAQGSGSGRSRSTRRWLRAVAALTATALVGLLPACSGGSPAAPSEPPPTPRTGPAETRPAVRYGPVAAGPQQTLDLYLPAGDGRTVFPMLILIHGGGFVEGSSADYTEAAQQLVGEGFAVASLNYRLSGEARFPAGVADVKAAVRFLRVQAPAWGIDPHRFAVWGASAGGYLAATIGATGADGTFDDPALGNPHVSSAVQAVVDWFGPSDFATMDAQAREAGCDEAAQQHDAPDSPESLWLGGAVPAVPDLVRTANIAHQVGAARSLPPFLLVHGTADCTVPAGQSRELRDALTARGARVTLTEVEGAGHGDPRIDAEQTAPSLDFVRSVLGR